MAETYSDGHLAVVNSAERSLELLLSPLSAHEPSSGQPLSETSIRQISDDLRRMGEDSWSRAPRLYAVLRLINEVQAIDSFLSRGISDLWFPFSHQTLPDTLRSPSSRFDFLEKQQFVLTKAFDLEREDGRHRHFSKSEDVPLQKLEELGKGGFGYVDRVLSTITYREYARKLIPRGRTFKRNAQILRDYERELGHLKKLRHVHIVELVGSYTDLKYVGILMSPVADFNLRDFLDQPNPTKENRSFLRTFFGCLAAAMNYLHDQKIRHKDVKPQNVLVKGHLVFLTDFGVSVDWSEFDHATTSGIAVRTPQYCAPEVASALPRNYLSDMWSLGCVFLEIWTVLKGAKVVQLTDFLGKNGTHSKCYHANHACSIAWGESLKDQTGTADEDPPLDWIKGMLQVDQSTRWTALQLCNQIQDANDNPDLRYAFSGHCCIKEDDFANSIPSSNRSSVYLEDTGISSIATFVPKSITAPKPFHTAPSGRDEPRPSLSQPSTPQALDRQRELELPGSCVKTVHSTYSGHEHPDSNKSIFAQTSSKEDHLVATDHASLEEQVFDQLKREEHRADMHTEILGSAAYSPGAAIRVNSTTLLPNSLDLIDIDSRSQNIDQKASEPSQSTDMALGVTSNPDSILAAYTPEVQDLVKLETPLINQGQLEEDDEKPLKEINIPNDSDNLSGSNPNTYHIIRNIVDEESGSYDTDIGSPKNNSLALTQSYSFFNSTSNTSLVREKVDEPTSAASSDSLISDYFSKKVTGSATMPAVYTVLHCNNCNRPIYGGSDKSVSAFGHTFHPECLTCQDCGQIAATRFCKDGDEFQTLLCGKDYLRRRCLRCEACGELCRDIYVITSNGIYHTEHFNSSACSGVSDRRKRHWKAMEALQYRYNSSHGHVRICTGCDGPISAKYLPRYLPIKNGYWHPKCREIWQRYNLRLRLIYFNGQDFLEAQEDNPSEQLREKVRISDGIITHALHTLSTFEEQLATHLNDLVSLAYNSMDISLTLVSMEQVALKLGLLFHGLDTFDILSTEILYTRDAKLLSSAVISLTNMVSKPTPKEPFNSEAITELKILIEDIRHHSKSLLKLGLNTFLKFENLDATKALEQFLDALADTNQKPGFLEDFHHTNTAILFNRDMSVCKVCGSPTGNDFATRSIAVEPHLERMQCNLCGSFEDELHISALYYLEVYTVRLAFLIHWDASKHGKTIEALAIHRRQRTSQQTYKINGISKLEDETEVSSLNDVPVELEADVPVELEADIPLEVWREWEQSVDEYTRAQGQLTTNTKRLYLLKRKLLGKQRVHPDRSPH